MLGHHLPSLVFEDHPVAGSGVGPPAASEAASGPRRDVVVGVDLSVRVGDRGADLGPAVLEHEHELDTRLGSQGRRPLGPQVDHPARPCHTERRERRVVIGRVEHHLAPPLSQRRPAVGEGLHVVRLRRLEATDAERATGRRQVRASLSRPHDVHDRPEVSIDTSVGRGRLVTHRIHVLAIGRGAARPSSGSLSPGGSRRAARCGVCRPRVAGSGRS